MGFSRFSTIEQWKKLFEKSIKDNLLVLDAEIELLKYQIRCIKKVIEDKSEIDNDLLRDALDQHIEKLNFAEGLKNAKNK